MTNKRDGLYVWVTWLSKFMAGETTCEFAPWFKSHYQNYEKAPSGLDLARWQIDHTRISRDVRIEREGAGDQVLVERQTQFNWQRPNSDLVLGGKPDMIAIGDKTIRVIDIKTGQPKASHQVQVMIYMYCLPKDAPVYRDRILTGQLVYNSERVDILPTAIDAKFEEQFNYFLDIIDTPDMALKIPSMMECRDCDITKADCDERIEDQPALAADEDELFG